MRVSLALLTPPRTKKTHNQSVSVNGRSVLLPSKDFAKFERKCLRYAPAIRQAIEASSKLILPIGSKVSIKALVYREADTGDFTGYVQAIGDVLQAPRWKVQCPCGARRVVNECTLFSAADVKCSKCGNVFAVYPFTAKQSRKGMGIIDDDRQIRDWDGTRLLVDRARPRIELTIEILSEGLFT